MEKVKEKNNKHLNPKTLEIEHGGNHSHLRQHHTKI